jgi:hypothetical protein
MKDLQRSPKAPTTMDGAYVAAKRRRIEQQRDHSLRVGRAMLASRRAAKQRDAK